MHESIRIEDLTVEQISELLETEGDNLSPEQAAGIQQFIRRIGGIENAVLALEMLREMDQAA